MAYTTPAIALPALESASERIMSPHAIAVRATPTIAMTTVATQKAREFRSARRADASMVAIIARGSSLEQGADL
ncbi:MAG: hypothetical protein E6G44_09540 [Actinobacteria bacterium]|nr:MAG: hypothetical protein E6G44_09540 [Actinomycetota bacterium]